MESSQKLRKEILARDGRGYPALKDLKGRYDFENYILSIDHVQSDPFATPSDVSVHISHPGFPEKYYKTRANRITLQDQLLRFFSKAIKEQNPKGKSIQCASLTQQILERSAVSIDSHTGALTVRFNVGFPARGRSILGKQLVHILFDQLPQAVTHSLIYKDLSEKDKESLLQADILCDRQQAVRKYLQENHLAAFVANGAVLPRISGASDLPMQDAVPFQSPGEYLIEIPLPDGGSILGMGIPDGITLIIGGGYHGKSTLLKALEAGVYNHIQGDGREYVITKDNAMKVRAEDGRCVHNEDISLFIRNLPGKKDTRTFVSEDASGSTSQAANVVEAIESGSEILLIDEDTSATNFMVRDDLMAKVVEAQNEPIVPFSTRIKPLFDQHGISTILVAGSSGAFFAPADHVIQMQEYIPIDRTKEAKLYAKEAANSAEEEAVLELPEARLLKPAHIFHADKMKVKTTKTDTLQVAREPIDIRALEQLRDSQQSAAIGKMLVYTAKNYDSLPHETGKLADFLLAKAQKDGLSSFGKGNLAMPRKQELLGALNRWRSMQFDQKNPPDAAA